MKIDRECKAQCEKCYPLTVFPRGGYAMHYRYCSSKCRLNGLSQLKHIYGDDLRYLFDCYVKRGVYYA